MLTWLPNLTMKPRPHERRCVGEGPGYARKPRNRPDDPKRRRGVGRSSQKESAIDAAGVSGAAPTAERRPTEPVSARNSLPEAQKRARNAGEKQQSAKRTAHEDGGDERVGIRE